jgi:hypothetical protein
MRRRLPIAPRPYADELLSSWQGRVACRYGIIREALGRWAGLSPQHAAPGGFVAADYAPTGEVLAAWSRVCRLDPARIDDLALRRSGRALDRYVWAHEAGSVFVGYAVCPACLEEDAAAGRDQYFRRRWLQIEALLCERHDRLLVEACQYCGAGEGVRLAFLAGQARLVCRRCGAVIGRAAIERSEPSPQAKAIFRALGAREPDDAVMATACLLWSLPRPGMPPWPVIFRLLKETPALGGAPRDCKAPLSSASRDWRLTTWIAVAQLLDRAGARDVFGAPRFEIEQLKTWTRSRPAQLASRTAISTRSASAYASLAENILASPEWRSRPSAATARERLLGRLMREALSPGGARCPAIKGERPGIEGERRRKIRRLGRLSSD